MHIDKKVMRKLFLLVAGSLVFAWLLLDTARATALFDRLWDIFAPFILGAGIAFIFNVPMRAIENHLMDLRKPGLRRGLAIVLTIFLLVLLIMFVFELLLPQLQQTFVSLSEKIPAFVDRTAKGIMAFMAENPDVSYWIQETFKLESLDWTAIVRNILAWIGNQVSTVMGGAVLVIGNVAGALINLVISLAFSIYCLARKDILCRQGRRILYSVMTESHADELIRILRLTNITFSNFISGQCLEAVILGILFAVVMSIFQMPYVALVSVIISVTALIPLVGAFVGCIVGAFFILVNDPIQAAAFVLMFLILQQLEGNLIYPRVVGNSVGLPGMWVLVAVTVGGELMGVGGMLVMIPLTSVVYALGREFTGKRLAERNIPEEKLMDHPLEIKSSFQKNKERKERIRMEKMREKWKQMYQEKLKKK